MPKRTIERDRLVDTAYDIAEHLLAAVQNGTDCATLFALLDSALYGESATRR